MKGIDVFVVRFTPFVVFAFFIMGIVYSIVEDKTPEFYYLHSNSAIYALGLFLISLANKRYHCIYNRAMYIFLIIVPIINYLEVKYDIFPCEDAYSLSIAVMALFTIMATSYLAIRHFILKSKRKLDNGSNQ